MLKNYLVVAVRSFLRHKLYSLINIVGLTIGLVCVILIGLYAQQELSFDSWLPESDDIYRINLKVFIPGRDPYNAGAASSSLGPTMKAELPGVLEQTRIHSHAATVMVDNRRSWAWVNAIDENFFTMFRLPFASGDPATVLSRPDSVVLSQSEAKRLFGDADPVGRTLLFDQNTTRTVTGVLRDIPYNTQFEGDFFVRYPPQGAGYDPGTHDAINPEVDNWTRMDVSSYVRLARGVSPDAVADAVPSIFGRHLPTKFVSQISSVFPGMSRDGIAKKRIISARLIPLKRVHMEKYTHGSGMKPAGSSAYVYGFIAIAFFILIIAGCNFTNLATVRAGMRAREIALRKALGATRNQIAFQFLMEAVLTAFLALFLAFSIADVLLPAYSHFLGHTIRLSYLDNWTFVAGMLVVALLCGLLGGLYPALVLSRFRPSEALHTAMSAQSGSGLFRTILVVFQFAVSIGLGAAVAVIFTQIRYSTTLDLGFDHDNVVILRTGDTGISAKSRESMLRAVSSLPGVRSAALSNRIPGGNNSPMNVVRKPDGGGNITALEFSISPEFKDAYGIRMLAGRFLSRDRGADIHSGIRPNSGKNIVIDEYAARAFGLTPAEAVGKTIEVIGGHVTIVGVVRNLLFRGAQSMQISPTIYFYSPDISTNISVLIRGGEISQTLTDIDRTWHRFIPDRPVSRWFANDSLNKLYADAERQGHLISVFVVIAIFIACLGLFGLAAFTAERRKKEIGIRKVFGARRRDIVRLLLWRFSVPVLIANVIAWPLTYLWLRHWLEGYAYHITINPLYFMASGGIALVIAWATIASHALQVSSVPPANALRSE